MSVLASLSTASEYAFNVSESATISGTKRCTVCFCNLEAYEKVISISPSSASLDGVAVIQGAV